VIVADEAVSALDVSIQAQIINLLVDLRKQYGLSYLFIAHDLSVVEHISDRVAIMYLGKIVEYASKEQLFSTPLHPYTKALLEAVPAPDPAKRKERRLLEEDVPSPVNPPSGCRFHPLPARMQQCSEVEPELKDPGDGRQVACHLY
jgi:oligopeptide/dipeptide ABC transporter ATP-binding protein